MADKLEIILKQLPTKILEGQIVFVVACEDTPDLRWIQQHIDELNERGEWIRLKVAKSVRENEVPPNTAVIVCLINVIEGTILQMKKRARNERNPCRCLSASLTKNQLKLVLEAADKVREKLPVAVSVETCAGAANGNGHHSASKSPFTVAMPEIPLSAPANGRLSSFAPEPPSSPVEPVRSADPSAEKETEVDAEEVLKVLDELPSAADALMQMVGKTQHAVILLSTKADTLELQKDELMKEKTEIGLQKERLAKEKNDLELLNEELRRQNASLEESNRALEKKVASMEAEVSEFNKMKSTLATFIRSGG